MGTEDDPLQLEAIVDEAVLRNPVGWPRRTPHAAGAPADDGCAPTVILQVLPAGQGVHPALESGFFVLSFGDLGEPNTAYVEHALGAAHLEKEPHVTLARLKFDRLRTLALAPAESQDVIRRVAGES